MATITMRDASGLCFKNDQWVVNEDLLSFLQA